MEPDATVNHHSPGSVRPSTWILVAFSLLYVLAGPYGLALSGDEYSYVALARTFARGEGLSFWGYPGSVSPVWPLAISPIWGPWVPYALALTLSRSLAVVLAVANVILITAFFREIRIGGRRLDERTLVLAQILTFGNFFFWATVGQVLTEQPSITLIFTSLLIMQRGRGGPGEAVALGFLTAALFLTKYNLGVMLGAYAVAVLVRGGFRRALSSMLVVGIIFTGVAGPWITRTRGAAGRLAGPTTLTRFQSDGSTLASMGALIRDGTVAHLTRFHELFTTLNDWRSVSVSLVFLIVLGFFFWRAVRVRDGNEGWVAFTVLYLLGLIVAGTGFTRYWVRILPMMCVAMAWYAVEGPPARWGVDVPEALRARWKAMGLISVAGLLALVAAGRFDLLPEGKVVPLGVSLVFGALLVAAVLVRQRTVAFSTLAVSLVLLWSVARPTAEFLVLERTHSDAHEQKTVERVEVARFIEDSVEEGRSVYVLTDRVVWAPAMIRRPVRHPGYTYADEQAGSAFHFIVNAGTDPVAALEQAGRQTRATELVFETEQYRVYSVELRQ